MNENKHSEKLLIVDDEELIRQTLARSLSRIGYEVDTADSAEEAIRQITQTDYDVHISDIKMPGESGLQLLERARSLKIDANFIMITAHGDENTAIESLNKGAFAYLKKPVSLKELKIIIERCLEHKDLVKNRQLLEGVLYTVRNFEDKINNPLFSITLNTEYLKKVALANFKDFPDFEEEILKKLDAIRENALKISNHILELRKIKEVKMLDSPVGKMLDV